MIAIITGASKGLGKESAYFLAEKGFHLHLLARSEAELVKIKAEIEEKFIVKVQIHVCDFKNEEKTFQKTQELAKNYPKIDLLLNNVGAFDYGSIENTSPELLNELLNINFKAAYYLTQAYLPQLKQQKSAHVFNIGSIVSKHPRADVAAYTISKFALSGFTKVLREELRPFQVKVTELIPGSINTSSWDGVEGAPKQDFIQPKEILAAIWMCYQQTAASNIEEIVIRPLNKDF